MDRETICQSPLHSPFTHSAHGTHTLRPLLASVLVPLVAVDAPKVSPFFAAAARPPTRRGDGERRKLVGENRPTDTETILVVSKDQDHNTPLSLGVSASERDNRDRDTCR